MSTARESGLRQRHVIRNSNMRMTDTHKTLRYISYTYICTLKNVYTHTYAYACTYKGVHYTAQLNMSHQYDRPSEKQRGNELERWGGRVKKTKKSKSRAEGERER